MHAAGGKPAGRAAAGPRFWELPQDKCPKLVLGSPLGANNIHADKIAQERIAVAVMSIPELPNDYRSQEIPGKYRAAFAERFVILHKSTLEDVNAKYRGQVSLEGVLPTDPELE